MDRQLTGASGRTRSPVAATELTAGPAVHDDVFWGAWRATVRRPVLALGGTLLVYALAVLAAQLLAFQHIARADYEGLARRVAAGASPDQIPTSDGLPLTPVLPWSDLILFTALAVLGVVLVLVGRRPLAFALPVVVTLACTRLVTDDDLAFVPQPFSDSREVWSLLGAVLGDGGHDNTQVTWWTMLALAAMLAVPALVTPQPSHRVDNSPAAVGHVLGHVLVPIAGVSLVVLSQVSWFSASPVVVLALVSVVSLTSALIVEGAGPRWLRLSSAVVLPPAFGPLLAASSVRDDAAAPGLVVAAATASAVATVGWLVARPTVEREVQRVRSSLARTADTP